MAAVDQPCRFHKHIDVTVLHTGSRLFPTMPRRTVMVSGWVQTVRVQTVRVQTVRVQTVRARTARITARSMETASTSITTWETSA